MPKRKYSEKNKEKELKIKRAKKLVSYAKSFKKKSHQTWFVSKSVNAEGFIFSYGPPSEVLLVEDENENGINPLQKLKFLFQNGFIGDAAEVVINLLPYFDNKYGYDGFISAQSDKEKASSLGISFIYVIDASKKSDLSCLPFSACNTKKPAFLEQSFYDEGIQDHPGNFFLVPASCKPNCIIGAFAEGYLAHALNVSNETLIVNPSYTGDLNPIKNALNIRNLKRLNDCRLDNFTYDNAKMACNSGQDSLEQRYLRIKQSLVDKIIKGGVESICQDIHLIHTIRKIINNTPFFPEQLKSIKILIERSLKGNLIILKAKVRGRQFEVGTEQPECLIYRLPLIVRHEIYENLYPFGYRSLLLEFRKRLQTLKKKFAYEVIYPTDTDKLYSVACKSEYPMKWDTQGFSQLSLYLEKNQNEIISINELLCSYLAKYKNETQKEAEKNSNLSASKPIDLIKPSTSGLTSPLEKGRVSYLFSLPNKEDFSLESESEQENISINHLFKTG